MVESRVYAKQQGVPRYSDDTWVALRASRDGSPIGMPWQVALTIEGKAFQIRQGNLTTPVTGRVDITDTLSEMAAEAASGYTLIPMYVNCEIEALGGTLPQACLKSVGAVITTLGTQVVPMNLRVGGPAAAGRAAAGATAGLVVVAAELNTTTRVIVSGHTSAIGDAQPTILDHQIEVPHILVGPASVYLQVGTVTTGSTYFAFLNYAELLTNDIT